MPQTGQQPVKSISATGFVAKVEATPMLAKPSYHFAQYLGAVLEYAALGDRHANRSLIQIQSDLWISFIRPAVQA